MRVILKEDVPNLGDAGQLVAVKPGYGRNFLIPRGKAILASEGSVRELEHQKRVADAAHRKQVGVAKALADKVAATSVSIKREAGEDDKLFGSVTNRDIVAALAEEGVEIDRLQLKLEEPIKAIGMFTVPVKLHREVTAELRVFVTRA